jgi:beta-phosphoglucomutase-like phosphatase (HAD superfamily)
MDGAHSILDWLKGEKIKISVVTDRRILIDYVRPTLEFLKLYRYISVLVTLKEVNRSKPNPEPFLFAASRLDIDPSNCIVIGDLPEDIIAGKMAGMRTVAYLDGYCGEKILKAHPDFSIDKLTDLKIFIRK